MAAAMGGIDALAFTGGVGEHSTRVRQEVCDRLAFLGLDVDPVHNAETEADVCVSIEGARVPTYVVQAREDLEVARGVREVLAQG
jgi:acetate kinase